VSLWRVGPAVRLVVADAGPGMPPEVAARAFERFARADASRSRSSGGAGLGLAIVRAIVTAHGGAIALEAVEGRGTTVTIDLPAAGPPAPGS
jgi:two-component system OmpR family sensor kinase